MSKLVTFGGERWEKVDLEGKVGRGRGGRQRMGTENHVGSFDVQMKHLNPLLPPNPRTTKANG
jgi:hypothetical protein